MALWSRLRVDDFFDWFYIGLLVLYRLFLFEIDYLIGFLSLRVYLVGRVLAYEIFRERPYPRVRVTCLKFSLEMLT